MHYIKFHIRTLKITPTCFDPKIIPEDDLRIETCQSDFKCSNAKFYIAHLLVYN